MHDSKHPNGEYGPGPVKYYPEIDSNPILISCNDDSVFLPEEEMITADMKLVKVTPHYLYKIIVFMI